jgi:predicted nuclease of restriction endonuclease-like (RecB) superfamily
MNIKKIQSNNYNLLIENIGTILEKGRTDAYRAVNLIIVKTYWEIGRRIVEYEQNGSEKAKYGYSILKNLSKDLKIRYGAGFSKSNVYFMRLFYIKYRTFQTVSGKLSWSHYVELVGLSDVVARNFYEKQAVIENWSVRELKRQINSALFYRVTSKMPKKQILDISQKGFEIISATDIVKDPYIFEFLNISENEKHSEKELEQKIINNLQMFILELGKGFTFVKRQFRITLDNNHFYVDLVFYHRILRCFVLFDLKIGKVSHKDIGQMNVYLNYFKEEEKEIGDAEPIGIILSAEKDHFLVKYALGGLSNKLFVSKYPFYLPDKKELESKLCEILKKR